MDDLPGMCGSQRGGELLGDGQGFVGWDCFGAEPAASVSPSSNSSTRKATP